MAKLVLDGSVVQEVLDSMGYSVDDVFATLKGLSTKPMVFSEIVPVQFEPTALFYTERYDKDAAMDWPTLNKTIDGWHLPPDDESSLRHHLQRVFGNNPDSPEKAGKWLNEFSELFRASPEALLRGNVPDVPQEIGLPWVISFLKDCP